MTYFGILGLFLLPPLLLLLLWVPRDIWRWIWCGGRPVNWAPYLYILLNIALALIYTPPWIIIWLRPAYGGTTQS